MRRLCTKQEKRIIDKNWKRLCTGFAGKSAHSKWSDIFWVLAVWMLVTFASIELFIINEWVMFIMLLVEAVLVVHFVNLGLFTIRVNRIKRKFLKKKQIYINGATVVDVKHSGIHVAYTYVEDDEYLFDVTPYGITIWSRIGNVPDIKKGDRLLLLYEEDPKYLEGEISLQIMRLSSELEQELLSTSEEKREFPQNIKFLRGFPHPNALKIQKEKCLLDVAEKEEVTAIFLKKEKRAIGILLLIGAVVFLGGINVTASVFLKDGVLENGLSGSALLIYLSATIIAVAFLTWFGCFLWKQTKKNCMEIKYKQEVLFDTIEIRRRGKTFTYFYEWNGMKFVEVKYEYISSRADYGKVYVKYFGDRKGAFMVRKYS